MRTILVEEAARLLLEGEVVAFPTETVYGLGGNLFNPAAIQKIYGVKGRPASNPLIAHVRSLEQIEMLVDCLPPLFFPLYAAFFPGPLTIVLKKSKSVPLEVSGGLETIAFRMPSHPIARKLLWEIPFPLAAPSANLSGKPSATKAAHVMSDFGHKIPGVIDGGDSSFGIESTVVSLLSEDPVILRPGVITQEAIESVIGRSVRALEEGDLLASPGMSASHYQPCAKVTLVLEEDDLSNFRSTQKTLVLGRLREGSEKLQVESLYDSFRRADQEGIREIFVICDLPVVQDRALFNRLQRASAV